MHNSTMVFLAYTEFVAILFEVLNKKTTEKQILFRFYNNQVNHVTPELSLETLISCSDE